MKSLIKRVSALLLAFTTGTCLFACKSDPISTTEGETVKYGHYGIDLKIADGEEISILSPKISEYLSLDASDPEAIAKYLYHADTSWYYSDFSELSWKDTGAESYAVLFSEKESMEDPIVVNTQTNTLSVDNCLFLEPGKTYYWKVIGNREDGEGSFSETGAFTVKDETVRTVHIDSVENVRDIGGWKASNGTAHVKYAMVYRGGRLNDRASDGKTFLTEQGIQMMRNELGIQSEIDLRGSTDNDGQAVCQLGSDLSYRMLPISAYSMIIPGYQSTLNGIGYAYDQASTAAIRQIFEYLADESHYPVYIHCNYGADRTGTIVFLLNALLGVSYEDLTKDFELTSLSASERRWRSDIIYNENTDSYSFTDSGVMQADESNFVAFQEMYSLLMEKYGKDTDLAGAVELYLKNACGVEQETLDSIRSILLEEN